MIAVKTFNGFNLANSDYLAVATSARTPPDANPVFLDQAMADAMYSGAFSIGVRSVVVTVRILNYADREILEAQLKNAVRPGTKGDLVVTFSDEGRDYRLACVAQSIHVDPKYDGAYIIIFQTGETAWRTVAPLTDTWSVSASGQTKTISVGGYAESRLSLAITPTNLPGTGWAYQRLYQLVNKPGYAFGVWPWCITLDTAALVTAGKIQAGGADLVVVVDGVIVNRWLAGMNTSSTHIWFNLKLSAGESMTLLTPVASSGAVTTLAFQKTSNNAAALKVLPGRGYIQHGTEWFEYTGVDRTNYLLTGVTRAALGTTMQAHALADSIAWVEHSIFILYGNSAATAPSLTDANYDQTKPVFDLLQSDNTTWVYTAATVFFDPENPNRSGAWLSALTKSGNVSQIYQTEGAVEGAAPAMGAQISSWYKSGKVQSERATATWLLTHPAGLSSVSMTGRKYRDTTLWPLASTGRLERSKDSRSWLTVWNETSPAALNIWETVTHASAAISGNMPTVRFIFDGTLAAQAGTDCYFEVLTVTVAIVSANEPTGTLQSEKSSLLLDISIQNTLTGDTIALQFPMLLNVEMNVDAEGYSVVYGGVNAISALSLDDPSRDIWIRLEPGVNTLLITGNNVAILTIAPSWYERRI